MPTAIAKSLLLLAALAPIALLAWQPPVAQKEDASAFVSIVAEQALPLPQPANPDEDGDVGPGMSEAALGAAPIAPLSKTPIASLAKAAHARR